MEEIKIRHWDEEADFDISHATIPHIENLENRFTKREMNDYGYSIIGMCVKLGALKTRIDAIESPTIDRYLEGQLVNKTIEIKNISYYLAQINQFLQDGLKTHRLYELLSQELEEMSKKLPETEEPKIQRILFLTNHFKRKTKKGGYELLGELVLREITLGKESEQLVQLYRELEGKPKETRRVEDVCAYLLREEEFYRRILGREEEFYRRILGRETQFIQWKH